VVTGCPGTGIPDKAVGPGPQGYYEALREGRKFLLNSGMFFWPTSSAGGIAPPSAANTATCSFVAPFGFAALLAAALRGAFPCCATTIDSGLHRYGKIGRRLRYGGRRFRLDRMGVAGNAVVRTPAARRPSHSIELESIFLDRTTISSTRAANSLPGGGSATLSWSNPRRRFWSLRDCAQQVGDVVKALRERQPSRPVIGRVDRPGPRSASRSAIRRTEVRPVGP